jgi:ribosomal protein S10
MDKITDVVVETVKEAAAKVLGEDKPLPLPETREQLLALHDVARRKRDAAPRDSKERVEASFEIERIEIQIARIERAMDPPLV